MGWLGRVGHAVFDGGAGAADGGVRVLRRIQPYRKGESDLIHG
ncbi:hypothetical protein ACIRVK_44795 [Streptomyces sp. NPDC101152]